MPSIEPSSTNGLNGVHQNESILGGHPEAKTRCTSPLKYGGSLEKYPHHDLTPAIGRKYSTLQIRELLNNPKKEEKSNQIKDLAITISERGVIFLRNQSITTKEMSEMMKLLHEESFGPINSNLHIHPLTEESSELGDEISVISSIKQSKGGGLTKQLSDTSRLSSVGWHSDITFEPVTSDYSMLKIHTLPETGGDTLWCSGYEIFEKLSKPLQLFLQGLTANHDAKFFLEESKRLGHPLREGIRGHFLNHGSNLSSTHPIIRTNPVTGWKSLFVNRGFTKRINDVTKDESDLLLKYLFDLVVHNHDAQVRFHWGKNDLAIWDNRCTWHTATYDYVDARAGDRVCSLGEAPYLDLNSKSRKEDES